MFEIPIFAPGIISGVNNPSTIKDINASAENRCKVFHKLAEVNAPFACEIEEKLAVVKGVFDVNDLHFKIEFFDALLAHKRSFGLQLAVALVVLNVFGGSRTKNL